MLPEVLLTLSQTSMIALHADGSTCSNNLRKMQATNALRLASRVLGSSIDPKIVVDGLHALINFGQPGKGNGINFSQAKVLIDVILQVGLAADKMVSSPESPVSNSGVLQQPLFKDLSKFLPLFSLLAGGDVVGVIDIIAPVDPKLRDALATFAQMFLKLKMHERPDMAEQKFFDKEHEDDIHPQEMFFKFDYDNSGTLDLYQFKQALKMWNHSINITDLSATTLYFMYGKGQPLNQSQFLKALADKNELFEPLLAAMGYGWAYISIFLVISAVILGAFFLFLFFGISQFTDTDSFGSVINSMFVGIAGIAGFLKDAARNDDSAAQKEVDSGIGILDDMDEVLSEELAVATKESADK